MITAGGDTPGGSKRGPQAAEEARAGGFIKPHDTPPFHDGLDALRNQTNAQTPMSSSKRRGGGGARRHRLHDFGATRRFSSTINRNGSLRARRSDKCVYIIGHFVSLSHDIALGRKPLLREPTRSLHMLEATEMTHLDARSHDSHHNAECEYCDYPLSPEMLVCPECGVDNSLRQHIQHNSKYAINKVLLYLGILGIFMSICILVQFLFLFGPLAIVASWFPIVLSIVPTVSFIISRNMHYDKSTSSKVVMGTAVVLLVVNIIIQSASVAYMIITWPEGYP